MSESDDPSSPRAASRNRRRLPEDAAWLLQKVRTPVHEVHREHWEKLFDELTFISADPATNESRESRLAETMEIVSAMRREYGFEKEVQGIPFDHPWMFDPMDGFHVTGAAEPDDEELIHIQRGALLGQAYAKAKREGREELTPDEVAEVERLAAEAKEATLAEGRERRKRWAALRAKKG